MSIYYCFICGNQKDSDIVDMMDLEEKECCEECYHEDLPRRFKQTRKDLNLTQRQLAKELGLSEKNGDVYIRKVENGRCEPSGVFDRRILGIKECLEEFKEGSLDKEELFDYTSEYRQEYLN